MNTTEHCEPMDLQTIDEAPRQQQSLQVTQPLSLIELAMKRGASLDQLRELLAMQERHEANAARKAFVAAMAAFKKNAPAIPKTKKVEHSGISYMHATLGNVVEIISKALGDHGFSVRFKTDQPGDGRIIVTCILTHDMGHSEIDVFEGPADTSGKKNPTQGIASAISYGRRYTILGVTGLATMDQEDDDGRGAGGVADDAAFTLRDDWIARVNAALNDDVLIRTWQMALAGIQPLNRMDVYAAVKAAVASKRVELLGAAS